MIYVHLSMSVARNADDIQNVMVNILILLCELLDL